ncbi:flagellar hook-length control protein FliK [Evansella vedderi]|uniref:Flagellar hook-length control protein FliK n=1 Tax=Evansella vedderi TaxID=38282 RepID=A0ABT9ZR53_9BACI|nr:flagellar hook-length control protein FliK [Evansella vedderi]MDQ0253710.1 flagellar hook-length control protein FliK [Evansella vedderi]
MNSTALSSLFALPTKTPSDSLHNRGSEERGSGSFFDLLLMEQKSGLLNDEVNDFHMDHFEKSDDTMIRLDSFLSFLQEMGETLDIEMIEEKFSLEIFPILSDEMVEEVITLFEQGHRLIDLAPSQNVSHLLAVMMAASYYEKQQPLTGASLDREIMPPSREILDLLRSSFQDKPVLESSSSTAKDLLQKLFLLKKEAQTASTVNRSSEISDKRLPTVFHVDMSNSHMAKLQQLSIHGGEKEVDKPSEQQLLRQIQQILARSQLQQLGNGVQQLTVKLHPQSLGRLDITIQQVNGVMVAKMMTTTSIAKDLIEGQLSQLRQAFAGQQIHVDRIEVTQQQQGNLPFHKQSEDGSSNQQEESQSKDNSPLDEEEDGGEEESFSDFLQATINTQV